MAARHGPRRPSGDLQVRATAAEGRGDPPHPPRRLSPSHGERDHCGRRQESREDRGRNGHARRAMATDAVVGAVDRPSPPLLWLGLAGLQMAAWDHVVLPYLIATTT